MRAPRYNWSAMPSSASVCMIFQVVLLTLLSSWTKASPVRMTQETSLGKAFLAIAKDYVEPIDTVTTVTRTDGYFYSELEASTIGPLATEIDLVCTEQGYIDTKFQSGNENETTSYFMSCTVPLENVETFEDAVLTLLEDAQDNNTTTYTRNTYSNSYPSTNAAGMAQQKALEYLLTKADTIEDVHLVFNAWQTVESGNVLAPQDSSVFTISLNSLYIYNPNPYPDFGVIDSPPPPPIDVGYPPSDDFGYGPPPTPPPTPQPIDIAPPPVRVIAPPPVPVIAPPPAIRTSTTGKHRIARCSIEAFKKCIGWQ